MKLEEAIVYFESLLKRFEEMRETETSYWGKVHTETTIEAIRTALAALRPVSRERVERVRGEWINTNKEVEQMCKCSKCGYPISYFWSRTPFCPNCGAPMTDEAVDMVLKRLEVPKDDQT